MINLSIKCVSLENTRNCLPSSLFAPCFPVPTISQSMASLCVKLVEIFSDTYRSDDLMSYMILPTPIACQVKRGPTEKFKISNKSRHGQWASRFET